MICSIVVLYEPKDGEIHNLLNYCDMVEFSYGLDNSNKSHKTEVDSLLRKRKMDEIKLIIKRDLERNRDLHNKLRIELFRYEHFFIITDSIILSI